MNENDSITETHDGAPEGASAALEWLNSLIQRAADAEVKRRLAQLQG